MEKKILIDEEFKKIAKDMFTEQIEPLLKFRSLLVPDPKKRFVLIPTVLQEDQKPKRVKWYVRFKRSLTTFLLSFCTRRQDFKDSNYKK